LLAALVLKQGNGVGLSTGTVALAEALWLLLNVSSIGRSLGREQEASHLAYMYCITLAAVVVRLRRPKPKVCRSFYILI